MRRSSRFIGWLMVLTTLAFVWPEDAFAQRGAQRGAPSSAPRGGARVGGAVPRGSYHGGYRPSPYRSYGYPRYGYSYAYPRYYPYSGYYAPFSWGFGFGVGFGIGWSGGVWSDWGSPYGYAYPYAPAPFPYYSRPYWSGYYEPAPQLTMSSRGTELYADAYEQQPRSAPPLTGRRQGGFTTLSLRVSPSDATVFVDGDAWDRPAGDNRFSIDLAEGSHLIEIRKEGYGSYSRRIEVVSGRPLTLNVGLSPLGFVPAP